jgi:hypothetical protein
MSNINNKDPKTVKEWMDYFENWGFEELGYPSDNSKKK